MAENTWPTTLWPEGVAHTIDGYDKPLYDVLDETARDYPDLTYTLFNGHIVYRKK